MDIALNVTTGDIDVINGLIYLVDNLDAITQQVNISFKLFLGEWFLNTSIGMPWFQDILIKGASFAVVQEVMKDTILGVPGILGITNFDANFDLGDRSMSLAFGAQSTSGFINFSQQVDLPVITQV